MSNDTISVERRFNPIDCARFFVSNLTANQRIKFKRMLDNGVQCGAGVAKAYNVPYETFISEVKAII